MRKSSTLCLLMGLLLLIFLVSCSPDQLGRSLEDMGKNIFGSPNANLSFATDQSSMVSGSTLSTISPDNYNSLISAYNRNKGELNKMRKQKIDSSVPELVSAVESSARSLASQFGVSRLPSAPDTGNKELNSIIKSFVDTFNTLESNAQNASVGDVTALRIIESQLPSVNNSISSLGLGNNVGDLINNISSGSVNVDSIVNNPNAVKEISDVMTMLSVVSACSNFTGGRDVSTLLGGILGNIK